MIIPGLKFSTERDLSRPTLGGRQAAFGEIWLGNPFIPWQSLVADVTGELLPNGLPAHPLVVITGPRQMGKSHLSLSQTGERAFSRKNFRAWYTAQTGSDARDQFLKFADETVAGHPLEHVVRTLRGNGHEVMHFPNGSTLRPHPPTESALHGKQSDRNDVDEAWWFKELEGKALMQAIAPTQLTRPGAQTFLWSAGGTAASTWLASLVARGRAGDPSICYFEFGIPDDLPLDDLAAIAAHHPAHGHLITLDSIRNLRAQLEDDAEFARAVGNRWTEIIGGAIPAEVWSAGLYADPIPVGTPIGYGAATAADRSETAIVAAALVDGVVVIEVLDVVSRAWSAADDVLAWSIDGGLAIDRVGPSASLADAVAAEGRPLLDLTTRDVTAACANLVDGLEAGAIKYRSHPSLDAAVKVAAKRAVQDGAWLWSRSAAGASIAALEAATLAVWALGHRPAKESQPLFDFGGEAA